eukprot:TRINITY_DN3507_c0_g1_i2.p1 TRINITY_DN3507_c0_g1~~TRINITY_DN3507_c0_g1_i2.p1  ORF type:complete len:513 (+),score=57.05 TRINITY_DN3507_c0_g1_i2:697-2235(+)
MGEKFLEIAKHALLGKKLPEGKMEQMMDYLSRLGHGGLEEQFDGTAATCLILDTDPKVQTQLVHIFASILEGLDGRRASPYPILEFPGPVPGFDEVCRMLLAAPCLFGIFDPGAVKQVVDLEIDRLQFFRCPYAQQLDPVWTAVINPPISEASTQILMACLVDTLAHKIPFSKVERNKKTSGADTLERFDATISFHQVALIFGEEKCANSKQSPSTELSTKSTPKHSTLPYFFGYSVVGTNVELWVLPTSDKQRKIRITHAALNELNGRVKLVMAMWRIVSFCQKLVPMGKQGTLIPKTLKRGEGVIVEVKADYVDKSYPVGTIEWVRNIADIMGSVKDIPGVVELLQLIENKHRRPVMRLVPVGHTGDTCTDEERFHGLTQVITTVNLLHGRKIVHNDLRWENTILAGDKWYIIDFDDATYLDSEGKTDPTPRHKKFRRDTHAPEIAVKHDHKVDVWALGKMILQLSTRFVPASLKKLAHATQCPDADQRPTLDALLVAIEDTHPAKRQRH